MKKKLSLVLSLVVLVLTLSACGTDQTKVDYNGKSYDDLLSESVNTASMLDSGIDYYISQYGASSVDDLVSSYGLSDYYAEGYTTWNEIVKEYGECDKVANLNYTTDEDGNYSFPDFTEEDFTVTKAGKTLTTDLALKFGSKEVTFEVVYEYYNMEITGITVEPVYSTGEKMSKAGLNTVISITIVFAVLILISLIISAFNIFPYLEKRKQEKISANKKAVVATEAEVSAPASEPVTDDTELIAVIAAAIAASEGTSTSDFVVRSINRR